jgi:hypothetical protein
MMDGGTRGLFDACTGLAADWFPIESAGAQGVLFSFPKSFVGP